MQLANVITTVLFLLATLLCNAQTNNGLSTLDSKINDRINELNRDKTDTIICYNVDCVGFLHLSPPDSCLALDIKYLLWEGNGKHYIQRFDECKVHSVVELNKDVFALLYDNYSKIKTAKIKYPHFTIKEKGKLKTYFLMVDHSCHHLFEIHIIGDYILKKDIDDFALETKYDGEKNLNSNFYSNQKSVLNKLKTIVERDIDEYNKNH